MFFRHLRPDFKTQYGKDGRIFPFRLRSRHVGGAKNTFALAFVLLWEMVCPCPGDKLYIGSPVNLEMGGTHHKLVFWSPKDSSEKASFPYSLLFFKSTLSFSSSLSIKAVQISVSIACPPFSTLSSLQSHTLGAPHLGLVPIHHLGLLAPPAQNTRLVPGSESKVWL